MRQWLEALRLPWDRVASRWRVTLAQAAVVQRLVTAAGLALLEWWPSQCRPASLPVWGRTYRRPRREGETTDAYRQRLALARSEPVGTRGWILDEVQRITGAQRVIELPYEGLRCGYAACGPAAGRRCGAGPLLCVGAAPEHQAEVLAVLEEGLPRDAVLTILPPADWDLV